MKAFKNQNGISMIEVMFAISIMGAAAFYFMKFQSNQMRAQKGAMSSMVVSQFINELKGYMAKPGVCSASFKDKELKSNLSLDKIVRSGGHVKYQVDDKVIGSLFSIESMVLKDVYIDELEEGATGARGEGMFTITFSKKNTKSSYGAKTLVKTFEIDFYVDTKDKIMECAPLGHLSLPSLGGSGSTTGDGTGDPGDKEYEKAFDESVKQAMKATGKSLDQTQINNTIKGNENLRNALDAIKNIKNIQKQIEKNLEE